MRNLVPHGRDISRGQYNEEEKGFIMKYGENAFYHWERMTDEQRADYEELEAPYSDFVNLFAEHYEDLKLYAIMYRNVPLYNIENDIYSILYFASHRDEIIGYKERLMSDKTSPQAQVALLYSENEALFPKFCIKYANVNFQPNKRGSKDWELSVNSIKNFRDGKNPHILSVNDLTTAQCDMIFANKGKIPALYSELCDKYLGDYPGVHLFKENLNEYDFARDCFVPVIIGGHQLTDMVIEFAKNKVKQISNKNSSDVDGEIEEMKTDFNKINVERKNIQKLISEKEGKEEGKRKEEEEIAIRIKTRQTNELFFPSPFPETLEEHRDYIEGRIKIYEYGREKGEKVVYGLETNSKISKLEARRYTFGDKNEKPLSWIEFEFEKSRIMAEDAKLYEADKKKLQELNEKIAKENERWRKRATEIVALGNEIKTRQEQADWDYIQFLKSVTKTAVFRIMYDNQNEIEGYVGKDYELSYNRGWLENPLAMKEMESRATAANSVFGLLSGFDNGFLQHNRQEEHKEGSRYDYLPSYIFEKWCEAVEEFWDEEEERKRKEEEARTAKYRYNQINAHPRDAKLSFDKGGHIYSVGGRIMDSVTTIIKNSFPEFDKKKWAPITAKKKGMTEREVLDMWEKEGEESREKGTLLHEKIESYYQGKQVYLDDTFRLFENMAKQVRLIPYRTEWAVYDYDLGVAGTVDFVDYQNGQYALYDWKRSEKVIVNGLPAKTNQYGEKGNYPIANLDNTPYWHYALQLSMYKYILEHNYGMEISRLRLGVFHPTYIKPYLLEMSYLEKEVNAIFSLRSEIIF